MFGDLSSEEQTELIQKQMENLDIYRRKSLTDSCYDVLASLTSLKGSGLKIYSRNSEGKIEKYFNLSISNLKQKLELDTDIVLELLKILLAKGFIDIKVNVDILEEFKESRVGVTTERSFVAAILIFTNQLPESTHISITERGATELLSYNVEKSKELIQKTEENRIQSTNDIEKLENAIKKFHEDIFTIFSLLLAVFAIIGLNVTAIPEISDHFIRNIVMINLTLCFSLCAVFTLLNTMLYKEKNPAMWKLLAIVAITFLIAIIVMTFRFK